MGVLEFWIFSFLMAGVLITMILFLVFGQVTVRKLRKNRATKDLLGVKFMNGWDILNAAKALSLPRWLNRRLERNAPDFFANSEAIYKNTTKFDRILGRTFFYCWSLTAVAIISVVIMDKLDVFN